MIGTRIGNWILTTELGTGSLGTVYRATNAEPKSENDPAVAAVKVLSHPLCMDSSFQSRFPAEMLALRRLTHPNIARFYDSGVHAGLPYYASEFVDGTDVAKLLAACGTGLNWTQYFFRIAIQTVRALKHAHHRSILHRELKPSNLILLPDGSLKVTDFGIAKILNRAPLTLPVEVMGTTTYLAPEHFTGKPLTRRSDLYALGGVLYSVLTGRPPFVASTAAELMHKHCYTLPDRPANVLPKLPHELDDFVCSLLAKDPARRPASDANLLEALDQIRGKLERKGMTILLPPNAEDPTGLHAPLVLATEAAVPSKPEGPSKWKQAALLGTLLTIVIGAILFAFFRPRPDPESLWTAAQRLMVSNDPDDWDSARDNYLDPITRWHPDWRPDDVREARRFLAERKELIRSLALPATAKQPTEAERLYHRGLKLVQIGDWLEARRTWESLARIFGPVPAERSWVELAKLGLVELANRPTTRANSSVPSEAIAAARKLRESGQKAEADAMLNAVEELYRDRPDVMAAVRDAR